MWKTGLVDLVVKYCVLEPHRLSFVKCCITGAQGLPAINSCCCVTTTMILLLLEWAADGIAAVSGDRARGSYVEDKGLQGGVLSSGCRMGCWGSVLQNSSSLEKLLLSVTFTT